MDGYMGMPYEDLIKAVPEYCWEMDELYVSPDGDRWYWIGLKNWVADSWERLCSPSFLAGRARACATSFALHRGVA